MRSNDFKSVYFVAAFVDDEPALWAMNRLDGTGLIYSVNDHAFDVSGMGSSENLTDPIAEDGDGASEALGDLRDRLRDCYGDVSIEIRGAGFEYTERIP